jgi:hypothetical protein
MNADGDIIFYSIDYFNMANRGAQGIELRATGEQNNLVVGEI